MTTPFEKTRDQIARDPANLVFHDKGYEPLFVASRDAKIAVIGHAPGKNAQEAGIIWGDASGERLISWMGIDEVTFRESGRIALLPMDFYYQGKRKSGDLPPRKDFAPRWHGELLSLMPDIRLMILVGNYAQGYYLGHDRKKNLTETVRSYRDYLPRFFPIVHPSPLNFRWLMHNPWFEQDVIPALQQQVEAALL